MGAAARAWIGAVLRSPLPLYHPSVCAHLSHQQEGRRTRWRSGLEEECPLSAWPVRWPHMTMARSMDRVQGHPDPQSRSMIPEERYLRRHLASTSCMHIHVRLHICTHKHIHAHTYMHTQAHTSIHICTHTQTLTLTHTPPTTHSEPHLALQSFHNHPSSPKLPSGPTSLPPPSSMPGESPLSSLLPSGLPRLTQFSADSRRQAQVSALGWSPDRQAVGQEQITHSGGRGAGVVVTVDTHCW